MCECAGICVSVCVFASVFCTLQLVKRKSLLTFASKCFCFRSRLQIRRVSFWPNAAHACHNKLRLKPTPLPPYLMLLLLSRWPSLLGSCCLFGAHIAHTLRCPQTVDKRGFDMCVSVCHLSINRCARVYRLAPSRALQQATTTWLFSRIRTWPFLCRCCCCCWPLTFLSGFFSKFFFFYLPQSLVKWSYLWLGFIDSLAFVCWSRVCAALCVLCCAARSVGNAKIASAEPSWAERLRQSSARLILRAIAYWFEPGLPIQQADVQVCQTIE